MGAKEFIWRQCFLDDDDEEEEDEDGDDEDGDDEDEVEWGSRLAGVVAGQMQKQMQMQMRLLHFIMDLLAAGRANFWRWSSGLSCLVVVLPRRRQMA